jgi:hypothetical protein
VRLGGDQPSQFGAAAIGQLVGAVNERGEVPVAGGGVAATPPQADGSIGESDEMSVTATNAPRDPAICPV